MKLVISDNERELDVLSDPDIRLLQNGLEMPLVARELTYAESADSDGRRRVRSKNQNAEGKIGLHISGTSDSHFWGKVDNVIELVESAHRNKGSIVYEPPGGTAVAYDLESITVTGLPQQGIELRRRRSDAEITFEARPYGRLASTQLFSGGTLSGPIAGTTVQGVAGQVMAFGDLELTDVSTQTRDFVEIGVQADFDPTNPEPLLLTAGTMAGAGGTLTVVTGNAGTASRPTGAYTTSGGNSFTIRTGLSTTATACATTSSRPHKGLWKVRARLQPSATSTRVRLAWRTGDGVWTRENWEVISGEDQWVDVDLGTINIPTLTGTHKFEARIEAASTTGYPNLDIDFMSFIPADRYLRLRGRQITETSSGLVAADDFNSHTAGTLTGKTPPITAGGNWSGAGDTDDFNVVAGGVVSRSAVSDTALTGRWLRAGTAVATATDVRCDIGLDRLVTAAGVFARYVNTSNFIVAYWAVFKFGFQDVSQLILETVVSGTWTRRGTYAPAFGIFGANRLSLAVNADGSVTVSTGSVGSETLTQRISWAGNASTQSGGALDDGSYGIYHENTTATAAAVTFDNFAVTTPSSSTVSSQPALFSGRKLQVRDDEAVTASSDGSHFAPTPIREGNYLLLPPATRNAQKSRLVVRARRNDLETQAADTGLTDNVTATLSVTPRVLLK